MRQCHSLKGAERERESLLIFFFICPKWLASARERRNHVQVKLAHYDAKKKRRRKKKKKKGKRDLTFDGGPKEQQQQHSNFAQ